MNYSKVNLFDIANGNGIRVSLFVSGCKFHCKDCFNQQAWDYNYGKPYDTEVEDTILSRLSNENFQGLSILGGDPLCQDSDGMVALGELCDKVHALGKDVWIWSGWKWEDIHYCLSLSDPYAQDRVNLLHKCDVFVDGPFLRDEKNLTLAWKGSSNQRVIDVKKSLESGEIVQIDFE